MEFKHIPVMAGEVIEGLSIKPDGLYADGTLGGGGHSFLICERLGENGRLIATDKDEDAIAAAREKLKCFENKTTIIRDSYSHLPEIIRLEASRGADGGRTPENSCGADGILLDLGVSSFQLDCADRGFSYMNDAPLDMRMDRDQKLNAWIVVNKYDEASLSRVIKTFGEERYAGSIAKSIVTERRKKPIETTGELAEIIKGAIPARARAAGGHPAKRTFQAIRIEVNDELGELERSLDEMIDVLNDKGRLCVITFHSLEDRIVKETFKRNENPCTCPPSFPVCVCGKVSKGRMITRKPVTPSEEETDKNPRAKSAKLRIFERDKGRETEKTVYARPY